MSAPMVICSARGCRRTARWQLRWRNPRLHDEARRKIWTACDEHRVTLGEFLEVRGFLKEVVPLEPAQDVADAPAPPGASA